MNAPVPGALEQLLAHYLKLERQARAATSTEVLAFSMVNDSQALFGYRHGALLIAGKVRALTGISVVEPNAPFVVFIERMAARLAAGERFALPGAVPMILSNAVAKPLADEYPLSSAASSTLLPSRIAPNAVLMRFIRQKA